MEAPAVSQPMASIPAAMKSVGYFLRRRQGGGGGVIVLFVLTLVRVLSFWIILKKEKKSRKKNRPIYRKGRSRYSNKTKHHLVSPIPIRLLLLKDLTYNNRFPIRPTWKRLASPVIYWIIFEKTKQSILDTNQKISFQINFLNPILMTVI